ncbi:MAG: RraA family protein [Nitratireductor sp.]|nr:RraA family protein [Nitratireductor sp.]
MGTLPDSNHRWKYPVPPFKIRRHFTRPEAALVRRLDGVDTTFVCDLVGRMYTMSSAIKPLYLPAMPVVGTASTVKCPPGDNLGVMRALRLVEPGDVLVIDGQGFTEWCLGGFEMLRHARRMRGLTGVIVNGAYRDIDEAQEAGFPIYGLAQAPFSGPKLGPAEINVPVNCGNVIVHPGDVIAASASGIAVVPQDALAAVVEAVVKRGRPGRAEAERSIENFMTVMDCHVEDYFDSGRGVIVD